jgi:hypothetical protein
VSNKPKNERSETAIDNHTKQRMLFEDIEGKKVEADFEGGEVMSDAGVLFLRETDRILKLIERVASVIRDVRHQGYVKHQLEEILRQRVFQIACGYEDADDSDTLRDDPAIIDLRIINGKQSFHGQGNSDAKIQDLRRRCEH